MSVRLKIDLSESNVNIRNNTSDVTANVYVASDGRGWNANNPSGSITINGTTKSFNHNYTTSTSWQWLASSTVTVKHNSDGSKSVSASATYNTGYSGYGDGGIISASTSLTLSTIPRENSISLEANRGYNRPCKIYLNSKSSDFTSSIYWKIDGEGEEDWRAITKNASAEMTYTFDLDVLAKSKYPDSRKIRTLVITHTKSGKFVGRNEDYWWMEFPSEAYPTLDNLDLSVIRNESYDGYYFIAGKSGLRIECTSTMKYNASLYRYHIDIYINNKKIQSTENKTGTVRINALEEAGDLRVEAYVEDGRNKKSSVSRKTVTVLSYQLPEISKFNLYRCDNNGYKKDDGTRAKAEIDIDLVDLPTGKKEYSYYYRKVGDSSWTHIKTITGRKGKQVDFLDRYFSIDYDYEIKLVVRDQFAESEAIMKIFSEEVILDFFRTGHGLTVGGVADRDGFNIKMKTRVLNENGDDVTEIAGELAEAFVRMGVD